MADDTSVTLEVGQPAPAIEAPVTGDGTFRLSDHLGSWVIVYFYPRANTPGWTHEAKDFEAHRPAIESLNALVVGVSADSPEVQQRFIDKFELRFPMISDTGKVVIDAYGAREVLGVTAKRKTFLVDPAGKLAHIWPKVKVEGHGDDVVQTLRRLAGAQNA